MDRVYPGHKQGYANPDYQLEDFNQNNGYQFQDDPKQAFVQTYAPGVNGNMFDDELDQEEDTPYAFEEHDALKRIGLHVLRVGLVIVSGGLVLGIPMLITMKQAFDLDSDDTVQNKNFVFWIFAWLLTTWATAAAAHIVALCFPYFFYFVAKYLNPAMRRYWRVFRPLKKPFVALILVVFGYSWFLVFVENNANVSYQYYALIEILVNKNNGSYTDPDLNITVTAADLGADRTTYFTAISIVDAILLNSSFWTAGYLFEKILIIYISVHYHYRSDHARIERSKNIIQALTSLYELSIGRFPLYGDRFHDQDIIIRDSVAAGHKNGRDTIKFFQKIGGASNKVLAAFGNVLGSGDKSHWLKGGSTYAVVEHALDRPASARALAQRLWLGLVPHGEKALTKEHLTAAVPLDQKELAEKCLKVLDENENGDIRLTEFEPMLVEAGKTRLNIYNNIQEIDHAINTLDWILLLWMSMFILAIVLLTYVGNLKDLKDIFGFVSLGLGVTINSLVTDFIKGSVYILFKHPYDIGDRIDLYNMGEGQAVGVIVQRVSLLYCVFKRTDTGALVQFPNSRLDMKRIENLSRSGQGDEKLKVVLNINTSFKDLEKLRDEMKAFVTDPENSRDYKGNVALRVKSIYELDKMEVAMVIGHKSNWSNDALKSARSSRLYCRLIEISRMIPLYKPGGGGFMLGEEGKPNYMVVVSEEEAAAKRIEEKNKLLKKRHDFENVNNIGLDDDEKAAKEAELKAAEADAYKGISSIPATIVGRAGERPEGKAAKHQSSSQATSSAVQYIDTQRSRSRPLMGGGSTSSQQPLYDNSYAYQGQPVVDMPPQTYDRRRAPSNNGMNDGRGFRI